MLDSGFNIMGKSHLFFDEETITFHCAYVTEIYDNKVDPLFHEYLKLLDIHVIDIKKDKLKVRLPTLWHHIKRKDKEFIIDVIGNIRAVIDKKKKITILRTLFSIGIDTVAVESENEIRIYGLIYKNQLEFSRELLKKDVLLENFRKHDGDLKKFYDDILKSIEITLESAYPEWKNPIMYWDDI